MKLALLPCRRRRFYYRLRNSGAGDSTAWRPSPFTPERRRWSRCTCARVEVQPIRSTYVAVESRAEATRFGTTMAMNSPSSPIEANRNASMMAAVMTAHDPEKAYNALDEREQDRLIQEELQRDQHEAEQARSRRSVFRRLLDRLPFG